MIECRLLAFWRINDYQKQLLKPSSSSYIWGSPRSWCGSPDNPQSETICHPQSIVLMENMVKLPFPGMLESYKSHWNASNLSLPSKVHWHHLWDLHYLNIPCPLTASKNSPFCFSSVFWISSISIWHKTLEIKKLIYSENCLSPLLPSSFPSRGSPYYDPSLWIYEQTWRFSFGNTTGATIHSPWPLFCSVVYGGFFFVFFFLLEVPYQYLENCSFS